MKETLITEALQCYHCHQACEEVLWLDDKSFCCYGCKTVYEILSSNDLCEYYSLDQSAGSSLKNRREQHFEYLDEEDIRRKVVLFDSAALTKVKFSIPAIHCISCIWLLENLKRLLPGVLYAEVHFAKKTVAIDFDPTKVRLSQLAATLDQLGYGPHINLETETSKTKANRNEVYKLVLAGFCFGNVMLFSFPEYLGLDHADHSLMRLFSWLNLALSTPVFFYSAAGYFASASRSFRQKQINIDVPIAAGLLALFARSCYDIITATGPGYLDSFTGLVFFLLIGRWFQGKTYESLSFDRDFKSYFPLAVQKLQDGDWKPVVIYQLEKGDTIKVRNMEIIPADARLIDNRAYIDYSFVTGEAKPEKVLQGAIVYAGGRVIGAPATLVVEKKTSQSHLTGLWNNEAFRKTNERTYQKVIDSAARRFTWIVMLIAGVTAAWWQIYHPDQMWLVLTSVLMVACPCALALAAPFTFGSMLRVFGKHELYLKNADVIERIAAVDVLVFDKTGTVTHGQTPDVTFIGTLTAIELSRIKIATSFSTHPLSTILSKSLVLLVAESALDFKELPGKGISAVIGGQRYKIGSAAFVGAMPAETTASTVYVSINDEVKGYFVIQTSVRKNFKEMARRLGTRCAGLLSGDNANDRGLMRDTMPPGTPLLFNQNPHDKLAFIKQLQSHGNKVMMLGDGLNDSGALQQSDVGLAVSDDNGLFTPACDGIIMGSKLHVLDRYLSLARSSSTILRIGFGISFFYNAIALSFAVTGHLTPLVAAILMPISSVSVVGFSTAAVNISARRKLR